jgi:cytochrome c oxidase subunit II
LAPWTILRRLALPLALAGLALAALAGPADATVLGPRAGHSPNADHIRTAYWVAIVIAGLLILVIHGFLAAALIRYRSRRGRTPERYTAGGGAFLRPAVPLVAVAVGLFVFGIVITSKTRDVEPAGSGGLGAQSSLVAQVGGLNIPPNTKPLEINVVGQRWLWRFDYPQQQEQPPYSTFSYNELVVPVDTPVVLHITSTDVDHRWFIPALGGQVDAIPGRVSDTWFRADREGIYRGQSTAYSGSSYAVMRAWVKVVSPAEYRRFVSQKKKQIAAAQRFVQTAVNKNAIPGAPSP